MSGNQFGLSNGINNNSSNYQNIFADITVYGSWNWNGGACPGSMSPGRGTLPGASLGLTEGSSLLVSDTLSAAPQTSLTMLAGTLQAKGLDIAQFGSVSVDSFGTLSIGSNGVQNDGVLTLAGGTLTSGDDKGSDNSGYFTGGGLVSAVQRTELPIEFRLPTGRAYAALDC